MISLKNPRQVDKMREAGALLYEVLCEVKSRVEPGVTTADLDAIAEQLIRKNHAIPTCLHYEGYPATLCTSINDEVVHGIPSAKRVLKEGDIVSIDTCLMLDGWQVDSAVTVGVGKISEESAKLIRVTEECFWKGVSQAVVGNRLGDLGNAIESHALRNGFSAIHDYTGHGIGREMHEDPTVWNYGTPGHGIRFRRGMTLAVEPMIVTGDYRLTLDHDDWCARTADHGWSSHYEHTIVINESGLPEILTLPGHSWGEGN